MIKPSEKALKNTAAGSRAGAVIWIGGWAADAGVWEKEITRLYPEYRHRFLNVLSLLSEGESLARAVSAENSKTVIAGWSLGSLYLHLLLTGGRQMDFAGRNVSFLSICPVFHFCNPDTGWPEKVVLRMIKKLYSDRGSVIRDFISRLLLHSGLDMHTGGRILSTSDNVPTETLADGLRFLMKNHLDPSQLLEKGCPIAFLVSKNDPVSPPADVSLFKGRVFQAESGHVPFLTHPAVMEMALAAAAK